MPNHHGAPRSNAPRHAPHVDDHHQSRAHHDAHGPRVIERQNHPISRKDIDPDTLRVLYKLKDANYESYLVGGAVRDLLMGHRPKDFDIATNARPRDLRRLFRNSREVGRRFRLVHVFFGAKNIEVATLRSMTEPQEEGADLYVEEDNQWGDLESDSFRRDFTVNALYYDIRDFAVIDYTGGVQDLEDRVIRCIGDPQVRFREDPVRMLRAIKFAARFGFTFEPETDRALRELQSEIIKASRFRVTEEIFRIIAQANREAGIRLLGEYGFLAVIYPEWLRGIGDDGFAQVCDYFAAVDAAAAEDLLFPLEVLTAGLFIPLLDTVDISKDHFHQVAARVTSEIRQLGFSMDLPKRLVASAQELLRGQLYMLFFGHLPKRVRRYVTAPFFDLVWRVHVLAFGHLPELDEFRAVWLDARKALRNPIGGCVDSPDRRDIFSFRGKTGGGRMERGDRGRGGRGGRGRHPGDDRHDGGDGGKGSDEEFAENNAAAWEGDDQGGDGGASSDPV